MGRYDKIRVYKDGVWRQPSRIYVYKSGWKDLGLNDSSNTASLNVRKNGQFVRATLNKEVIWVEDTPYGIGEFQLEPQNSVTRGDWCLYQGTLAYDNDVYDALHFRLTMYKETNVDTNILYTYDTSESKYLKITWLASGRIEIASCLDGDEKKVTSSNAVLAGNWVYLNIEWPWDTHETHIYFNGVLTKGTANSQFLSVNMRNLCGAATLRIKDTFDIRLYNYRPLDKPVTKTYNYTTLALLPTDPIQLVNPSHTEIEWV